MRILIIGAAVCLLAAFLGRRRLALWMLAGLGVVAAGLWTYEYVYVGSQAALFEPADVRLSEVEINASGYRPNLFELTGRVRNASKTTTLDGLQLQLSLRDCDAHDNCRELPGREQYVAFKLAPESEARFREKIYLDQKNLPQGELRLEYEVTDLRGHRPIWR